MILRQCGRFIARSRVEMMCRLSARVVKYQLYRGFLFVNASVYCLI
jgi:hypothetical protein